MSLHSLLHREHRDRDRGHDRGNGHDGATEAAPDAGRDHRRHSGDHHEHRERAEVLDSHREAAHDHFGGINWGASFFGWLVAVGLTVLLAGIASAIAAAVGENLDLTRADAESEAATIGLGAAIVLAVVMFVGYYAGGYVAGRMSRFDGARQGVGVWLVGLLLVGVAAAVGAAFGSRYNVLEQVELPSIDLSQDQLGWGLAITAVVMVVVMLLGAVLGGIVGHRYHHRVDRAAGYR